MKKIRVNEIQSKSALTKLKRKIPYSWDLNIYRGCQHACQYCYAMYSHKYLNSKDYFNDIYVKTNIVDELEKQLYKDNWKREVINIGGITDSYQPVEKKYKLMPEILKLLIKYKTPAIISTKSDLILRDFDLIDQLSRITYINIATSITTVNNITVKKIEPGASTIDKRFNVLKEFSKTNASTGLHVMPIVPFITDNEDNFNIMFSKAKDCNVDYVLCGVLYLRGATRNHFIKFIEIEYPSLINNYKELYKTGGANKEYKNKLYSMVNKIRDKYNLSNSYMKPQKEKLESIKML